MRFFTSSLICKKIPLLAIALGLVACGTTQPAKAPLTSLELQAFQKQTVEASKKIAFAATMSVFQDLGYTIESASLETGFITAQSPSRNQDADNFSWTDIFSHINYGGGGYPPPNHVTTTRLTRATAFIEDISSTESSIRLNFVSATQRSSTYGQTSANDKPILDPGIYQNAFTKIQEAIFIRQAYSSSEPSS